MSPLGDVFPCQEQFSTNAFWSGSSSIQGERLPQRSQWKCPTSGSPTANAYACRIGAGEKLCRENPPFGSTTCPYDREVERRGSDTPVYPCSLSSDELCLVWPSEIKQTSGWGLRSRLPWRNSPVKKCVDVCKINFTFCPKSIRQFVINNDCYKYLLGFLQVYWLKRSCLYSIGCCHLETFCSGRDSLLNCLDSAEQN